MVNKTIKRRRKTQRQETQKQSKKQSRSKIKIIREGGTNEASATLKVKPNDGSITEDNKLMTNQCFWISIKDWFNLKGKKIENLAYNEETDKDKSIINHDVTVSQLKKAFGCNDKYKHICNSDNDQVSFDLPAALLKEHILRTLDSDNNNITHFGKGLEEFAKKNKIVIRIFYMANDNKKIILPENFDIKTVRKQYDYGNSEEDIDNSIWIYATTNHFELITEYKSTDEKIHYYINADNSKSENIDSTTFKSYNSKGKLKRKKIEEYEKYDKIYNDKKEEIKKIMEKDKTTIKNIVNELESLLETDENDIINSILLKYTLEKSKEEAEQQAKAPVPAPAEATGPAPAGAAAPAEARRKAETINRPRGQRQTAQAEEVPAAAPVAQAEAVPAAPPQEPARTGSTDAPAPPAPSSPPQPVPPAPAEAATQAAAEAEEATQPSEEIDQEEQELVEETEEIRGERDGKEEDPSEQPAKEEKTSINPLIIGSLVTIVAAVLFIR